MKEEYRKLSKSFRVARRMLPKSMIKFNNDSDTGC